MRITGGELRGRRLKTPSTTDVRPTQDAVREAVFSMLANVVAGSRFLDLFAGTGAVGLEALSRGAASVSWVEGNPRAFRILQENIAALAGESLWLRAMQADAFAWLRRDGATERGAFDIIYADPPYGTADAPDRTAEIMRALASSGLPAARALFIAERRGGSPAPAADGWELLTERRYGRTNISIHRFAPCPNTSKPAS